MRVIVWSLLSDAGALRFQVPGGRWSQALLLRLLRAPGTLRAAAAGEFVAAGGLAAVEFLLRRDGGTRGCGRMGCIILKELLEGEGWETAEAIARTNTLIPLLAQVCLGGGGIWRSTGFIASVAS